MKSIILVVFAMSIGIVGCAKSKNSVFLREGTECEKLRDFWKEWEEDKIKTIVLIREDSNDPIDKMSFKGFEKRFFELLPDCCFCRPHPLASEWMECNRLDCIWKYIENEGVIRIAFYEGLADVEKPEEWEKPWAEIMESERIKEVLKLLYKGMKEEKDIYANQISTIDQMQITTGKHKFIIPISCSYGDAIRGIGWTSNELKAKLKEWGFKK